MLYNFPERLDWDNSSPNHYSNTVLDVYFTVPVQSVVLKALVVADQTQSHMTGVNGLYSPSQNLISPQKTYNSAFLMVRIMSDG